MASVNFLVSLTQLPLMGHNNCFIFCVNVTAHESSVVDSGFENLLLPFLFFFCSVVDGISTVYRI